ncbi:DEAD/DEAH box helicase family protein [Salimicrobium humidisoli]|uniref:DNA helicase n=1 Tax=Salimicrobium humidisoli TaxID=2029857 RepID=A0ABX4HWB8_9BACI|nr:DEAD/DEAH box helicase family protein [Salimicrobium humidisoli]PBB07000.1 DNA helicase [Salimicrobium humidisoli]
MPDVTLHTYELHEKIIDATNKSDIIYILTSFLMKSGVEMLAPALQEAVNRGADVKVLTGDYLYVTQPEALKRLLEITGENFELKMWQSNGESFHPKAYLFNKGETGTLIVGSSNMSRSAYTSGIEWNLEIQEETSEGIHSEAVRKFIHMFQNNCTYEINLVTVDIYEEHYNNFRKDFPDFVSKWSAQEEKELTLGAGKDSEGKIMEEPREYNIKNEPIPRLAQPAALNELELTLEEGYKKGMVVMATGLGKTYLAAFFGRSFRKILFIAHREEILYQAKETFEHVSPEKEAGIYNGKVKEAEGEMIFASIFTLSIDAHISKFSPDEFDLIIVDEFHHAAAKTYRKVINYFEPSFMLGLTATPERRDNKDVLALCEGNIVYEMNFIQAIQKSWLTPFRYYGVYDDTDYSQLSWLGKRYDTRELENVQLQERMGEKIYQAWIKYKQSRTLGFCSSINQAEFLAGIFTERGVKAIALHSRTEGLSRKDAIRKLKERELEVIFTVDLFNEGVDIPSVDTILFARPTESLVVYTQQLGRGLRLAEGKAYCNVIDLIGNYRNAELKMNLLGEVTEKNTRKNSVPIAPEKCEINIDTKAIDLLRHLYRKRSSRKENLREDYFNIKKKLGKRPTYLEAHLHGEVNSKEYKNIFGSYIGFLSWVEELSVEEEEIWDEYQEWIKELNSTVMTKSYKMVIFRYMLNRGMNEWKKSITSEEVAPFFHYYLTSKEYRKKIDFSSANTKELWEYNEKKVANLIKRQPMTHWSNSDFFEFDGQNFSIVNLVVEEKHNVVLYSMMEEICEYLLHYHFERKSGNKN